MNDAEDAMNDAEIERHLAWLLRPTPALAGVNHVHALLDGARDRRIHPAVIGSGLPMTCLFAGKLPTALEAAAPYLVQLPPEAPLLRYLLHHGWGKAWGVFFTADEPLEELRRHFRRLLQVIDERSGKRLFFRYYDPRVLRVYLPTCNEDELRTVFGSVRRFMLEGKTPERRIAYTRSGGQLSTELTEIPAPPAA
jgi:hypothetical protein